LFPSVPFLLHRLHVSAKKILCLEELQALEQLGIDINNYAGLNYSRTQAIADAAFFLGFDGLVVPSARYACTNLILFADRIEAAALDVEHSERVDWKVWPRSR